MREFSRAITNPQTATLPTLVRPALSERKRTNHPPGYAWRTVSLRLPICSMEREIREVRERLSSCGSENGDMSDNWIIEIWEKLENDVHAPNVGSHNRRPNRTTIEYHRRWMRHPILELFFEVNRSPSRRKNPSAEQLNKVFPETFIFYEPTWFSGCALDYHRTTELSLHV